MTQDRKPPRACSLTKEYIELISGNVAQNLDYQIGGDLHEVIRKLNGTITFKDFWALNNSDSGEMDIELDGSWKIYLSKNTSEERDRFTIAHELGHYILHYRWHIDQLQTPEVDILPMTASRYGSNDVEKEANWFAAAFLMPKTQFTTHFTTHSHNINTTANHFKVSKSAATVRAKSLGLI